MARGKRGRGARGNRNRKSTKKSTKSTKSSSSKSSKSSSSKSSSGSKNKRGSGARNNRSTSTKSTKSTSTKSTSTKSTSPSGNKRGSGQAGQGTAGGGQQGNPTKKSPPKKVAAPPKKVAAPPKKAPAPPKKTQAPKTTPAPVAKKKEPTKAQQMAKDRIAKNLTVSDVKAANKESMKVAAKERDQKFQATKAAGKAVQTFGGTRSDDTYSEAEKKAITDAGYAVSGYAKASAKGGLGQDTVPAGSFNISEEGKALAAQQKAEAAAKKLEADKKAAAEAAAKKAAAEKARKAEEKRQIQFDPSRLLSGVQNAFTGENLSSGDLRNPLNASNYLAAAGAGYTDAVVGGINFAKNLIPGVKQLPNIPTLPKYADKNLQNVRNISAVGIPLAQGVGAAKRFMSVDPISGKAGFANEIAKMTVSDAAYKAGKVPQLTKTGITNINPGTIAKAFTPQMVATGPTAGASGAIYGSMLAGAAAQQARDMKAGGLNIGSSGGVDSEGGSDPTARVSGFKSVRPLGIAKEALQGFGDVLTGQRTDFDQLGRLGFGATTDKLKDAAANMRINEVTDTLKKSPIRQAAVGFKYGIDVPDAIKQVDETRSVLNKTFKDFKGRDIDLGNIKPGSLDKNVKAEDLRGGISNVLYNLDRMPTLARGLSAFNTETDGGGDKEFRKDLRFTFNREVDAPTGVPGRDLMKATTPGLVNRVLSGKLKDMGQEAITQNNLTGGMTADKFDTIASTLNKNLKTEGTIANTRKKELTTLAKRFGPGGGQVPTPKSILGGVNPFRGRNKTGIPLARDAKPAFISSSPSKTGTPVASETYSGTFQVPQFQVPELPVQQGTDAGNLANIQNESYQSTFKNLMAINPNYSARFQMRRRRGRRRGSFKRSFSRRFFR